MNGGNDRGPGLAHDPALQGEAVRTLTSTETIGVPGAAGGPSRSQVIRGAAATGFATRTYQHVYAPYWDRAREVLHEGSVPPGYRSYVRRYFQLIRPREE